MRCLHHLCVLGLVLHTWEKQWLRAVLAARVRWTAPGLLSTRSSLKSSKGNLELPCTDHAPLLPHSTLIFPPSSSTKGRCFDHRGLPCSSAWFLSQPMLEDLLLLIGKRSGLRCAPALHPSEATDTHIQCSALCGTQSLGSGDGRPAPGRSVFVTLGAGTWPILFPAALPAN